MAGYLLQLVKMAALAAAVALVVARWLDPLDAALVGVVALYLLLVRVS